jgi:bifunctional UDP-N-acetylglucosamine pyrophosphorylase/glucosamine-1-phosphate N-acetyltransferase
MAQGSSGLAVVILAAGEGTRMRSRTPKVLHRLCGRPLIRYALELARSLGASQTAVVLGSGEEEIRRELGNASGVQFVRQSERLGTAHAALQARPLLETHRGPLLVIYGDMPLLRKSTIERLLEAHARSAADLSLLTVEMPEPAAYGRIVRGHDGRVERIVELAAATPEEAARREINPGVYVAPAAALFRWLTRIEPTPPKNEYYLTDILELARSEKGRVESALIEDWREALGVNSRVDLAQAEAELRRRINEHWMLEGVTFENPELIRVDADVQIGRDTTLAAGVALRGATRIGEGCRIDEGVVIEDSTVGSGTHIKPHCAITQSVVGSGCELGPSAHLRPKSTLCDGARVGNFVEVKNSTLGPGSKADHLSYIGDSDLGEKVSIGCGVITVNYNSEQKMRTTIEDRAFVGCNSNLIAPVTIHADAYVAAGSTITQNVPGGALGVARARQRNIEGWRARRFAKHGEPAE